MSDSVVVDASLAVKWVLKEPYTVEAMALLAEWERQQCRILAPSLLAFEVANALYKRVSRGELALDVVKRALDDFLPVGPALSREPATHRRAFELAHQFSRPTSYDAHYLALAERQGCECWTADERLWNAVREKLSWVRWIGEYHPPASSSG
ncbi:MAG: type II toxin-antitoxin system VapC family toxin [Deinococcus sp.]|nr:type II toxin-antitoxin system VapC family toxin [Deinococcus sp.]